MLKRIFLFVVLAYLPGLAILMVAGCSESNYDVPKISGVVSNLHHSADYNTHAKKPYSPSKTSKTDYSRRKRSNTSYYHQSQWMPPKWREKNWQAIIIHHSATQRGSMATIDYHHKNVNGWDGIGYDFVIGNGRGSDNGQVETTFRWTQQRTGAHCRTDHTNWANEQAVGVCLIGNFEKSKPNYSQMKSVERLVSFLSDRYDIPESRIYGHKDTPGHSTATKCPGRYFPMYSLKSRL